MPTSTPIRICAALALSSTLVTAAACKSKRTKAPTLTVTTFELPNRLRVEVVAGPCGDDAAVVLLHDFGTDHDPAGASGMGHLIERALATSARPIQIGEDYTLTVTRVPRTDVGAAVTGAVDWLRIAVTAEQLARARAEVQAELVARHGGDAMRTAMSFAAEAVQPTPGGGWRGGVAAEVAAIDMAALQGHWLASYTANARLVVVGQVDAAAVRGQIEKEFAVFPAAPAPTRRPPADATVTGTLVMGDAPAAVAIAVPAPSPSAPTYAAFLILAARLPASAYDPIVLPHTLFVTTAVNPGERPEDAAARLRADTDAILARPLATADFAATRARFAPLLGADALDPAACKADPRGFAIARARRAQLGVDGARLSAAIANTTPAELATAATQFDAKHTAAVIAGGTIR
jgi:zinc protease